MDVYRLDLILATILGILLCVCLIAPLAYPGIVGLDGVVGHLDHADLWERLDPFSSLIYTLGDYGCHQQEARSIIIGESQMPFCVRETMILMGTTFTLMPIAILGRAVATAKGAIVATMFFMLSPLEWLLKAATGVDVLWACALTSILSGIGLAYLIHCGFTVELRLLNRQTA